MFAELFGFALAGEVVFNEGGEFVVSVDGGFLVGVAVLAIAKFRVGAVLEKPFGGGGFAAECGDVERRMAVPADGVDVESGFEDF